MYMQFNNKGKIRTCKPISSLRNRAVLIYLKPSLSPLPPCHLLPQVTSILKSVFIIPLLFFISGHMWI